MADWEQPGEAVLEFCRRNPHVPVIRQCHFVGFVEVDGGWVELIDEIEVPGFESERAGIVVDTAERVRAIAFVVRQDGRRLLHAFDAAGDSGLLPIADKWQGPEMWRFIIDTCERALTAITADRPLDPREAFRSFHAVGHAPAIESWDVYTTVAGDRATPPFAGRVEFWEGIVATEVPVTYQHAAVAFTRTGRIEAILAVETGPLQGGRAALVLYMGGRRRELAFDDLYLDAGEFSQASAAVLRPLLQADTGRHNIDVPAPPAPDRSVSRLPAGTNGR